MRKNSLAVGKSTPIERFYAVGPKRAEAFHRMGIFTSSDLVYHFPRAYEPRGNVKKVTDIMDAESCSLILTIATEPKSAMIRKGMVITKFTAFDETGMAKITFFNQPYIRDLAHKGQVFRFYGKVQKENSGVSMTAPIMEAVTEYRPLRDFVPVYPLTSGISQKLMGSAVRNALEACSSETDGLADFLDEEIKTKYGLCSLMDALYKIHTPKEMADTEIAIRRLAFDELYLFALSMLLSKEESKRKVKTKIEKTANGPFLMALPYQLTAAQRKVTEQICLDMTGETCMNRLIVGDVGSGKTVCAAYAVYLALQSGKQAALMAPTEILARQHYADLSVFFETFGFRTALLVGSMTAAQKRKVCEKLALSEVDFVIGTHALIEDTVQFRNLALAVIDEQHRFGATQRTKLAEKTEGVHVLTMSATPIPRTLAMVLYCGIDVSVLDEMPPGRQKVDTFLVNESYRTRLNNFIRKNVDAGGQVYIVCPAVEEEETLENESGDKISASDLIPLGFDFTAEKTKKKAAVPFAKELQETFKDYQVAFIHGKMSGKEKDKVMNAYVSGDIQILVSTTVIEVGVNVPKATLMIVENADLFGLSALHQLRGRVGRGKAKSYCVLVSNAKTDKAKERMKTLTETSDGFKIAEKDLEMRGPGDFVEQTYGKTRQSGDFDLGIASVERDVKLFYTAFEEAKRTLSEDATLSLEKNEKLKAALMKKLQKPQA